jgi:glutamate synthase (NADPH/NADH) small chain
MADPKGFLKFKRETVGYRAVCERVKDFREVSILPSIKHSKEQASRCMDCGTPFCHWGCPIGNYIPEWNDFMFRGMWQEAIELLEATNNMPEITGRICPASCEYACVLGINDDAVTIRENELAIIEYAFKKGLIKPRPPKRLTGKRVAVIGSGPAGLSCAAQLNKAGHNVVIFEKDDKIGGILRYGIPDFKLNKKILDRRIKIWQREGIEFKMSVNVGVDYLTANLLKDFDAICLAIGSRVPRDINIEGRNLKGIYFAMDYLVQANRRVAGEKIPEDTIIDARGKKVVVIGGGDTGADCVGVAHRQGADCVVQIELLPQPPEHRTEAFSWPKYPMILKTSTSHEEGGQRKWSILTKKFIGEKGKVKKLSCVKVQFSLEKGAENLSLMKEIAGSEFEIEADLVILAVGFVHPQHEGLLLELGVEFNKQGNIKTKSNFLTSVDKVFAAGDMRRGQSWVVWAIAEGRKVAHYIDKYLMTDTSLPNI